MAAVVGDNLAVKLVLLFVSACAYPHLYVSRPTAPITWTPSCAFSSSALYDIRRGVDIWNDFFRQKVFVEVQPCQSQDATWFLEETDEVNHPTDIPRTVLAETWPETHTVIFYREWKTIGHWARTNVTAHELGHVLGLSHSGYGDGCLMTPNTDTKRDNRRAKPIC